MGGGGGGPSKPRPRPRPRPFTRPSARTRRQVKAGRGGGGGSAPVEGETEEDGSEKGLRGVGTTRGGANGGQEGAGEVGPATADRDLTCRHRRRKEIPWAISKGPRPLPSSPRRRVCGLHGTTSSGDRLSPPRVLGLCTKSLARRNERPVPGGGQWNPKGMGLPEPAQHRGRPSPRTLPQSLPVRPDPPTSGRAVSRERGAKDPHSPHPAPVPTPRDRGPDLTE